MTAASETAFGARPNIVAILGVPLLLFVLASGTQWAYQMQQTQQTLSAQVETLSADMQTLRQQLQQAKSQPAESAAQSTAVTPAQPHIYYPPMHYYPWAASAPR